MILRIVTNWTVKEKLTINLSIVQELTHYCSSDMQLQLYKGLDGDVTYLEG